MRRERDGTFQVVGLVLGDGLLAAAAHAWGFAEGRASGPWLFRKVFGPASRKTRFVPADEVTDWGPGRIELAGKKETPWDLREAERP